jgi:Skp family chaperone for outer membrane proteins
MGILSYTYNAAKAAIKGKGKVFPTITKVKPNLKKTVKQTKSEEYSKRIRSLSDSEDKIKTGKKMMQEGQRARKKMADTGRAFQFRSGTSYHALGPGDKQKYGKQMKVAGPQKKFKTGKELEREKKMGGGMMGRRFGMKKGTPKPQTNVDKIKKAFPVTKKGLKKIDPEKQKGLAKLKKARPDVVRKMGYFKKGGRS